MGLQTNQKGKYITILQGKFTQRVDEGMEGAVMRTNKLGKNVWELFYDAFTGKLTNITIKDGEYGKTWNFSFEDDGEYYTLQLSYSNSYAKALLKMLPNIDLSQPFTLTPSVKVVDGKSISSLFANQNNLSIKHAYVKDTPGYPAMESKKVKGNIVWDDSDQLDFLLAMVNKDILPNLNQSPISSEVKSQEKEFDDIIDEDTSF